MRARELVGGVAVALLAVPGCHDPSTEVVIVVDTDLSLPAQANVLEIDVTNQNGVTEAFSYGVGPGGAPFGLPLATLPGTLGVVPGEGQSGPFSVMAALSVSDPATFATARIVQRTVSGISFVHGEKRAVFISLLRACVCQGTSCPDPRTAPECADVNNPTLTVFDPAHLPRLSAGDGGVASDGSIDQAVDRSVDAVFDAPGADRLDGPKDGGVEAGVEAPSDRPGDLAAEHPVEGGTDGAPADAAVEKSPDANDGAIEAPPAMFPRGHACTANGQCQEGFCVDSVCCQNACVCGTCGGGTPGTCVSAAAGSDPRNACGAFTCNGTGACETTCAEGFGACSNRCKIGSHCDGQGKCVVSTTEAGFFCVVDSCLCKAGLTCPAPDAGGAGKCQ
jgi:hypothetical protein